MVCIVVRMLYPITHQSSNMFKSGHIKVLHPDINLHILYTVLCSFRYISQSAYEENLFYNQELF